jgi:hypothetical protein
MPQPNTLPRETNNKITCLSAFNTSIYAFEPTNLAEVVIASGLPSGGRPGWNRDRNTNYPGV